MSASTRRASPRAYAIRIVVDVYDVESLSGELCIVMEYVEGTTLSFAMRTLVRESGVARSAAC